MSETPRYYKWFPDKEYDLGTMPFEGDFTKNDRIIITLSSGTQALYVCNNAGTEFGRYVNKKVGNRV